MITRYSLLCFFVIASCAQHDTRFDRKLFRAADTNSDKLLSYDEANRFELARVFKDVDANGDGRVTFAEAEELHPEFTRASYNEYDSNRDGAVTYNEFYNIQTAKGGVRQRFTAADANKDGFVTIQEADERVKWLMDQAEPGYWQQR